MSEEITSIFASSDQADSKTRKIGDFGEQVSAEYLQRCGYTIVVRNFKTQIGRNSKGVAVSGEIDLIALDADVLCFIEIKTRSSDLFASPISAINLRKQRQIIRTAKAYRRIFNLNDIQFRYDAVAVLLDGKRAPTIELFKDFWNEKKFKKKRWVEDYHF